jgi:hypothetical protein
VPAMHIAASAVTLVRTRLNHILKLSQGKHLKSSCFKLGLCIKRLYIKVAKSDTVVIFEKLS